MVILERVIWGMVDVKRGQKIRKGTGNNYYGNLLKKFYYKAEQRNGADVGGARKEDKGKRFV